MFSRRFCLRSLMLGLSMCALGSAWAADKPGLVIWTGDESFAAGFRKVAEEYTRRTGIPVTVSMPAQRVTDAFQEAASKGLKGPDIFIWPHDHIGEWARKGWILPVNPSPRLKDDVYQIVWDALTSNGKQWAYPIAVEVLTMVYNKNLVAEPPKNYEDLPALHQKLKGKGVTTMSWDVRSSYYSWPLLAAGGANVFSRDMNGNYLPKQVGVNQPTVLKGLEFTMSLVKDGIIPGSMQTKEAEEAMKNGKLGILVTGPWLWGDLKKANINYGIAPLPNFGGRAARPFVGVVGAMVSAKSTNQKAAFDFLENAITPQGLQIINKYRPLGIPASKELFWGFYEDEHIRKAMEGVFTGGVMPNNPEMQYYWKYFDKALADSFSGAAKPKDALDAAAKAMAAGQ